MLNQPGKNHFCQVAMIQSQYESKRKNLLPNSSLLSNKSPLRQRQYERENYNNMNTPTRMQANRQLNNNSSMMSNAVNKILCLLFGRVETIIMMLQLRALNRLCLEESLQSLSATSTKIKPAEFLYESEEGERFYFCQICAIPVIAQNFQCVRINNQNGYNEEQNSRLLQINQFLKSIDQVASTINEKKFQISRLYGEHNKALEGEKQKITEYYEQIHDIINEHMSRVMDQLETEYKKSAKSIQNQQTNLNQSLRSMKEMKDDIVSSTNSVIIEASEPDYRSVMNEYYNNLESCKKHKNSNYQDFFQSKKTKKLVFGEIEPILQGITRLLSQQLIVEWDDEVEQEEEAPQTHNKSPMININNITKTKKISHEQCNQLQSERQNPIQCLQTEERNKSNLKQLGGLFCSFDD